MSFDFYKESYAGAVREITLGKGDKAVKVGGESCYPFYQFEGKMPNPPKIAMEVWDIAPTEWPSSAIEPFKDVISDPAAWAKKCVDEYGAEMIVLQLKSTDPNDKDAGAEEAVATVKKVLAAIKVPLIIWGVANVKKDEEVLKKICEECQGQNLILGPVEDANHKGIGAAAMAYGQTLISSSPIDVNLAKQVNILLENLGMPMDRIIVDPTTGGLGYGMEYSYSVMERLRMAALAQGDDKLQFPVINNLANEIWKSKEAKQSVEEAPTLGDPEKRGILMEAVGAVAYLMSGSNILIMRHPEAIRLTKSFIGLLTKGGSGIDIAGISKRSAEVNIDYAGLAPQPDLTIEEEVKKPVAAKPAVPKPAPEKPAAKPAPAAAATKPAAETKPAPAVEEKVDTAAQAKAAEEIKAKAEADAKVKADAAAKVKADAEAKAKAEAVAKAKAEADAKQKAEEDARKAAAAKREAAEQELRQKRAAEREARLATRATQVEENVSKTAAAEQKTQLEKMINKLDRIHRRAA